MPMAAGPPIATLSEFGDIANCYDSALFHGTFLLAVRRTLDHGEGSHNAMSVCRRGVWRKAQANDVLKNRRLAAV